MCSQVTMLSEELKLASPDLDAIERWRAKEAECTRRVAELDGVRGERETVRIVWMSSVKFASSEQRGRQPRLPEPFWSPSRGFWAHPVHCCMAVHWHSCR